MAKKRTITAERKEAAEAEIIKKTQKSNSFSSVINDIIRGKVKL